MSYWTRLGDVLQNNTLHGQLLQENKLKLGMLKHASDQLKLEDQLREYALQKQQADLQFEAQDGLPDAQLPKGDVAVTQPSLASASRAGFQTAPVAAPAPSLTDHIGGLIGNRLGAVPQGDGGAARPTVVARARAQDTRHA